MTGNCKKAVERNLILIPHGLQHGISAHIFIWQLKFELCCKQFDLCVGNLLSRCMPTCTCNISMCNYVFYVAIDWLENIPTDVYTHVCMLKTTCVNNNHRITFVIFSSDNNNHFLSDILTAGIFLGPSSYGFFNNLMAFLV